MKELITHIVREMVDAPDSVAVNEISGKETSVFEITVGPGDLGHIIGKNGRNANALRTLVGSIGAKQGRRLSVEILEPKV